MKRLVLISILLCLAASPAWSAAPVVVQHKSAFASAVTTVSATFASAVTAGNMILVLGGVQFASTLNTPTMTGETFTAWTSAANAGSFEKGQTGVWATDSAAGGQTTVTLTVTGAADIHLHIVEISGQAASPRDIQGNTESTTMSVSTSATTATANDLIVSYYYDNALNHTISAGSGYAQVEQSNNTSGGDVAFSESKTVSATGVQTAAASGNAGDIVEQSIVAVAGTAGGGGTTPVPQQMTLGVGSLAYNINQPALDGFRGCLSTDASCTMEADLCDEMGNCLRFLPGGHTLALNFVKNGASTQVATSTFQVTSQ